MRILLIDNYDSFTWSLAYLLESQGARVTVLRNDQLDLHTPMELGAEQLWISPGPSRPQQAGLTLPLLARWADQLPVFGVCLGHQALAVHFGGRVVRAQRPRHGSTTEVFHQGRGCFRGLPSPLSMTQYNSLVVERASLPACLEVTAWSPEGEIMGLRHRSLPLEGIQFHPESCLSERGADLIRRFLYPELSDLPALPSDLVEDAVDEAP